MDVGVIVAGLSKSKKEKIRLETLIFYRDTFLGRPARNVAFLGRKQLKPFVSGILRRGRVRPNWQGDSMSRQPHLESNLETVLLQEAEVAVPGRGVLPLSIPLPRL